MKARARQSGRFRSRWARRLTIGHYRLGRLDPTLQGLLWTMAAGLTFALLNTLARYLTTQLAPFHTNLRSFKKNRSG